MMHGPINETHSHREEIHTVAHIDFMPDRLNSTLPPLRRYLAHASRDPDVARVELLQQINAPNHFTLLETLKDKRAYDAHVEATYTREFRSAIQPALGSPYDERLHVEFAL